MGASTHPTLAKAMRGAVGDLSAVKTIGQANKHPTGWINRNIWNKLSPDIRSKFNNAISKGIVAPKGQQGVIVLSKSEDLYKQGYTHKLKILGKGGDLRIYGKQQANGHIIYDRLEGH